MIEGLAGWDQIPELNELHSRMRNWYRYLRLIDPHCIDLKRFALVVVHEANSVSMRRIFKLQRANSQCADDEAYTDDFLDHFLDGFLLSRIGSNMLLDQYFARAPKEAGGLARKTGIISPRCDAVALCKQAADYASRICQMHTGQLPVVLYDNYEAGKGACQADSPCYFSYIPGYLRYIMVELLKNSFKATLMGATAAEIAERPIHILICRDECHVAIRVSDRAGGIPSHVGERIWSYLYGAAARGSDDCSATPLSGYGVGCLTANK
ncbi:[Pyruvate dehydrogenase (acetyl-transferring)] kinase isozyme 2 [Durusdinium trenchii]|uniref:Protein-serine/threonine kinase n=1 Tax=Durusdinium trenchii TaxID=1381693 RepID=A0ABP0M9S7_9DINO